MKPLMLTILIATIAFTSLASVELAGVQEKIDAARDEAFSSNDISSLNELIENLEDTKNPSGTHLADYWTAYAYQHKGAYYAYKVKSEEDAMNAIKKGKSILIDLGDERNSEDYALLANLQSMTLAYVKGMKIMKESRTAEDWAEKAIELDPNNPRAYFVSGQYDFYKPAFVGGGKKAVKLLAKSVELYKAEIVNPALPSWGFDDAYNILARAHLKKDNVSEAKVLIEEGLCKFPEHYGLLELKAEIVD